MFTNGQSRRSRLNMAQRVMDWATPGTPGVSRFVAEDFEFYDHWRIALFTIIGIPKCNIGCRLVFRKPTHGDQSTAHADAMPQKFRDLQEAAHGSMLFWSA